MYLRRCHRSKDGKRHAYWALVKSVRTAKGPRQQVVAYLGGMDESGRLGVHQLARGIGPDPQQRMFDATQPRWVEVDLSRVRVENTRSLGGPWLALQIIKRLGLPDLLDQLIGEAARNELAKRGYSRDSRPDCKQVCIALVVSRANLEFLKEDARRYIVGTPKSMLKRYEKQLAQEDWSTVHEGLEVKLCADPDGGAETFILCRSADRRQKEKAMHERFEKRIEEGLTSLAQMAGKRAMTAVQLAGRGGTDRT